jgi:hypothetical protein
MISSIALDSNNNPHIIYVTTTNELKYAFSKGSNWTIQAIDLSGNAWIDAAIALDSSGKPHIVYSYSRYVPNDGTKDLRYAVWTGSNWTFQTVDTAHIFGWWPSIALDSNDNPHISYVDPTENATMKYASWNGSSGQWNIQVIDSGGTSSIAVDSKGYPHISYGNYYDGLKYASWNGTTWDFQTVDPTGGGSYLTLDSNDSPHISYLTYLNDSGYEKYAVWSGKNWSTQIVDANVWDAGRLALDSRGNPHITYYMLAPGQATYVHFFNLTYATIAESTPTSSPSLSPSVSPTVPEFPHVLVTVLFLSLLLIASVGAILKKQLKQ